MCVRSVFLRTVDALADSIAASAVFHAVYVLPSAHIGIIAHVMATVQSLQPKKIGLSYCCGINHVCVQRAASRCSVSVRPLAQVFASSLRCLQDELPSDHFSHAIVWMP